MAVAEATKRIRAIKYRLTLFVVIYFVTGIPCKCCVWVCVSVCVCVGCVCVCVHNSVCNGLQMCSSVVPLFPAIIASIMVLREEQRLNLHEDRDSKTLYFQVCYWYLPQWWVHL